MFSKMLMTDMLLKIIIYANVHMYYIFNQNDTKKNLTGFDLQWTSENGYEVDWTSKRVIIFWYRFG